MHTTCCYCLLAVTHHTAGIHSLNANMCSRHSSYQCCLDKYHFSRIFCFEAHPQMSKVNRKGVPVLPTTIELIL